MSIIKSILECLWGPSPDVYQTDARTSAVASDIVNILLTGETREAIQKGVKEQVDANGWSDSIAQAILHGLNDAIKAGAEMAGPAADALNKAKEAAADFAKEHPVFTILLALGVLAALAPWVLEVLGFGELGPIAGSFAARWQAAYAGYVPRAARSLGPASDRVAELTAEASTEWSHAVSVDPRQALGFAHELKSNHSSPGLSLGCLQ
ncbi:hypothetical protein CBS147346_938 [Aspergillus niger]|nr:hypothetical protein CBS147346_938 [Aspergillus niger]